MNGIEGEEKKKKKKEKTTPPGRGRLFPIRSWPERKMNSRSEQQHQISCSRTLFDPSESGSDFPERVLRLIRLAARWNLCRQRGVFSFPPGASTGGRPEMGDSGEASDSGGGCPVIDAPLVSEIIRPTLPRAR